jgi:alanyl-tRNA synthetase
MVVPVMTEKLYYHDPYLREFEATVQSVERRKKDVAVVLDRTAFYPEGGGQPADRGWISDIPVKDVQKKDDDVVHVLPKEPPSSSVVGRIDWNHRFDYMQQHTGQHIISGALIDVADVATVSVHQGESYTTIETDAEELSSDTLGRVERRANEMIGRNIPVATVWTTDEDVHTYPLRRPPKFSGKLRVVQVGDFDCVACGGVHAERTGEVGMVKCIGTEKIRGRVRTIWKIGTRAFEDYGEKSVIVASLIDTFSVQQPEILDRVAQVQDNLTQTTRELHMLQARLAEVIADGILASAERAGTVPLVTEQLRGEEKGVFRGVVERIGEEKEIAACLVNHLDGQVQWSICVSGLPFDFRAVQKELLAPIQGKGGGRPPIYQGIGANPDGVERFFDAFRKVVRPD